MNVITDHDQFLHTYWTNSSQDTYLPNILTQNWQFSDTQIRRILTLFEPSSALAIHSREIWELVLPALLRNKRKGIFK